MRANPRSLGPRGSPQGDRERARMTWYPHRRVQRKGETGHFITGSPAKRFPCTEQPHCSLPSAFRGWGPAKGWPRVQVRTHIVSKIPRSRLVSSSSSLANVSSLQRLNTKPPPAAVQVQRHPRSQRMGKQTHCCSSLRECLRSGGSNWRGVPRALMMLELSGLLFLL